MCSGHPAVPSAPVSAEPLRSGNWAIHQFATPIEAPSSIASPRDDALLHPIDLACSVFHPPRLHNSLPAF
jgi:hypothetical protein